MKDNLHCCIINNGRKVINKIDSKIPCQRKYDLFYRYINHSLKIDFKKTDKEYYKKSSAKNIVNIKIPNKYWVMWWQGEQDENIPQLVKNNIKNIKDIFGEKNVIVITKYNYNKYVNIPEEIKNKLKYGKISFTHWSDVIRFNLLNSKGGIWIDSTVMISPKFKEFIVRNKSNKFITICENSMDYHNISFSQWTTWFIGGVPHYDLFEYVCIFYDNYFKNHEKIIDYFLLDDVIAHYYQINSKFKNECKKNSKNWHPYYWIQNFTNKYNVEMEDKFNLNINYSIQKLTYKFDSKILEDHTCLAFHILNQTDYYERNSK